MFKNQFVQELLYCLWVNPDERAIFKYKAQINSNEQAFEIKGAVKSISLNQFNIDSLIFAFDSDYASLLDTMNKNFPSFTVYSQSEAREHQNHLNKCTSFLSFDDVLEKNMFTSFFTMPSSPMGPISCLIPSALKKYVIKNLEVLKITKEKNFLDLTLSPSPSSPAKTPPSLKI